MSASRMIMRLRKVCSDWMVMTREFKAHASHVNSRVDFSSWGRLCEHHGVFNSPGDNGAAGDAKRTLQLSLSFARLTPDPAGITGEDFERWWRNASLNA